MSVRVGIGHPVTLGLLSPWAQNVVAVPFASGGATVESIHQADELGQGVADLPAGPGPNLQPAVDVDQGTPAVELDFVDPVLRVPVRCARCSEHRPEERERHVYEYGPRRPGDPPRTPLQS